MVIKRVWIEPGCILCQLSADTCPAVFVIQEGSDTASVREGVDLSQHEAEIKEAAAGCPVQVIQYEES